MEFDQKTAPYVLTKPFHSSQQVKNREDGCIIVTLELKINQEACDIVNDAKIKKKRICAVGTTSMRAIESAVSSQRTLNTFDGWTNKFIFPPYDFSIANCMITNFHTPKSTLLMMASAFIGHDLMKKAYEIAIEEKYNFYSYGDAMLII